MSACATATIAEIAYDESNYLWNVRFYNGAEYQYLNVPPDVYPGVSFLLVRWASILTLRSKRLAISMLESLDTIPGGET